MKKIIRLTERDLTRIVKRTIREMENDIDDSVYSAPDDFKGYREQIISYLNYNGIDPESDDEIRDGLLDLRRQGDNRAIMFIRRLSKDNR
jgi:hypothetical protein